MEVMHRSKKTEIGLLPDNWQIKPLKLISAFISKGATPTTYGYKWERDGVLFLRSECVSEYGLDLSQSMFISPEAHTALIRGEVRSGDIVMTITGNVGRVVFLDDKFGFANTNQHIARVRIVDPNVYAEYIYHYLSQSSIRKYYNSILTGQAYPQISLTQVRDTQVPIPPLHEQQAIAEALSEADVLIEALGGLLAKKRQVKQGAMQELLMGKSRLPNFGGEWRMKRLGDECELITKGTTPTSLGKDFTNSGINFIKVETLNADGKILGDMVAFIDEETHKLLKRSQLKEGDLLISIAGALGRTGIVRKEILPANTNQALAIARLRSVAQLNLWYIYHYLKTETIKKHIEGISVQGAQANLSLQNIADLPIYAPDLPEQTAIAEILSDMDAEIAALQGKLSKARQVKQGMMSVLLTGKIRLNHD